MAAGGWALRGMLAFGGLGLASFLGPLLLSSCAPLPPPAALPAEPWQALHAPEGGASEEAIRQHLALSDGAKVPTTSGGSRPSPSPELASLGLNPPQESNDFLASRPELLALLGPLLKAGPGPSMPAPWGPGANALPPSVNLQGQMPPVGNQANRPVCELFALTAALDHLTAKLPQAASTQHSVQFLWWNYQRVMASQLEPGLVWGDTGTDGAHLALLMRPEAYQGSDGLTVPGMQGLPSAQLAPFRPDQGFDSPSGDPVAIAQAHLGALAERMASGEAIPADGARLRFLVSDLNTLKQALAWQHPVVIGLPCDQNAWRGLGPGRDLVPELTPDAASLAGAHAVLLVGYEDDPALPGGGAFRFRNSWGEAWGAGGYGRLSYQMVLNHAHDPYFLEGLPAPFQARYALTYPKS